VEAGGITDSIISNTSLVDRQLETAVMGEDGHIEYLSSNKIKRRKIPKSNYDPAPFAGIYALDVKAKEGHRFIWVSLETNSATARIEYLSPIRGFHVDVAHMRLAVSWLCKTKHRADIWNLETNEIVATFDDCGAGPYFSRVNLYGNRLLVIGSEDSIFFCHISTKSIIFFKEAASIVEERELWFAHQINDFTRLLITKGDSLKVLDTVDGKELMIGGFGRRVFVTDITASPDNLHYLVFCRFGAYVFDALSLTMVSRIGCNHTDPTCLGFDSVSRIVYFQSFCGYTVWKYSDEADEAYDVDMFTNGSCVKYDSGVFNPSNRLMIWGSVSERRAFAFPVSGDCDDADNDPERPVSANLRGIYCSVPQTVLM
jgi:hypothetical protein